VNEAALSAVSLAFPIQNLMIAFAVGTAVGVNAYLSRCLGEGNRAEASRAAMNGLFLAFCGGIAFLVFGILGARAFIASQTTDAQIMQYGADYLSICTLWCMGLFLQCMLEKLLVSTGRSAFAMASQGHGVAHHVKAVDQAAAALGLAGGNGFFRQAALFCGDGDQLLVVQGNPQKISNFLGNLAAAGCIFTRHRNNQGFLHCLHLTNNNSDGHNSPTIISINAGGTKRKSKVKQNKTVPLGQTA
jgi:hypothetical protein